MRKIKNCIAILIRDVVTFYRPTSCATVVDVLNEGINELSIHNISLRYRTLAGRTFSAELVT